MARVMRSKERDDTQDPGYIGLANAIIAQAYHDYIDCEFAMWSEIHTDKGKITYQRFKMDSGAGIVNQEEIRNFFKSQFYESLTDISGDYILGLAEKEIGIIKRAIRGGMNYNMFVLQYNRVNGFTERAQYACTRSTFDTYRNNTKMKYIIRKAIDKYERRRDWVDQPEMTYYILDKPPAPKAKQPTGIRNGVAISLSNRHVFVFDHEKDEFKDLGNARSWKE